MLVGEVRCATLTTGCSCTLSGGSQWSSGPTYVSKYAHVLRASLRRKCVWSTVSLALAPRERTADPPRDGGRCSPQQQDRPGYRQCAGDRCATRRSHAAAAMTGAIPSSDTKRQVRAAALLACARSTSLDGFHSRRRRCVMSIRPIVRTIASRLKRPRRAGRRARAAPARRAARGVRGGSQMLSRAAPRPASRTDRRSTR